MSGVDGQGRLPVESLWDQWARVPEATKQWLWLNDRMLLPPAVWQDLQDARLQMWGAACRDEFRELTPDAWEFIRQQRPEVHE